jgi:hypothetical protein
VVVVTQNLGTGIGYCEGLYLRYILGEDNFNKLLQAHGMQGFSPLEPTWKCPGAPSVGSMEASPCPDDQDNERCRMATMVGARQPSHLFYGHFCCQSCYKKFQGREMKLLLDRAETADTILDSVDEERLECLMKKESTRRGHVKVARGKRIEREGLTAVRKVELAQGRTAHSRKTENHENDPVACAQASKHNREKEQKRLDLGGKPKVSGTGKNRKIKTKKVTYPLSFMNKLTLATQIWAREYGRKFVVWNDLIELFDLLLIREQTALGVDFTIDGKPKYLHYSYITAVAPVLEKCEHAQKKWKVLDYVEGAITTNERTEDLLPRVVQLLYEAFE